LAFYDSTILIIEDSKAVTIILSQYLKKIGFTKIVTCETGKDGIKQFDELISLVGVVPIVFLDFQLDDMEASEIAPILFSKTPEVKIILETARDKNEEQIKTLFSLGISDFIAKPLRFEKIKEIIQTIKIEFELDESMGIELELDKVREHMMVVHRTSVTRIAQNCGYSADHVLSYLRGLTSKGDVLETNSIKEVLCNKCNSINISTIFSCPKCTSSNFNQAKLIEHYDCGNISKDDTYEDDLCPQCKKEIKVLGVDYKVMANLFTCNDCEEIFPDPSIDLNCLKCGNKFTFSDANWIQSPTFMWMKESAEQNKEHEEISNPEIIRIVSKIK